MPEPWNVPTHIEPLPGMPSKRFDAAAHLRRRFVGERHREDAVRAMQPSTCISQATRCTETRAFCRCRRRPESSAAPNGEADGVLAGCIVETVEEVRYVHQDYELYCK